MLDIVIVGQGLAGTVLAWHLRDRSVLVIDREEAVTSSKIAAGLMTPITGKRLAVSWRWDEVWPAAVAFYRQIEAETGERFFHPGPAVRIFADEAERDIFEKRSFSELGLGSLPLPQCFIGGEVGGASPPGEGGEAPRRGDVPAPHPARRLADLSPQSRGEVEAPSLNPAWFAAPLGAFEMPAARLDVPHFLAAFRDHFRRAGQYLAADLDLARDLELLPDRVRLRRLGVESERLVFCQGYAPNPHFSDITFNPVKGEILALRVPGLAESRVVHRGVWLAPLGGECFLAGSTYERTQLDCVPTQAGRDEICTRIREFLRLPFEMIGHAAAVRPVIDAGRVVAEWRGRLGFFNGLGSKGSLLAPFAACGFAEKLPRSASRRG